jgi:hypothetical protein
MRKQRNFKKGTSHFQYHINKIIIILQPHFFAQPVAVVLPRHKQKYYYLNTTK